MQIKEKANINIDENIDLKIYDGKIDPGAVNFTSGFSQEIAHGGQLIEV